MAHLHLFTNLGLSRSKVARHWARVTHGSYIVDRRQGELGNEARYVVKHAVQHAARRRTWWGTRHTERLYGKSHAIAFAPFRGGGGEGWVTFPQPFRTAVAAITAAEWGAQADQADTLKLEVAATLEMVTDLFGRRAS